MPLDYYIWVVKSDERTIVIDTGFEAGAAAARGRTLTRPVSEGLAAVGVDPTEVLDVVITHMHYDHAGNLPLFPARALSCAGCRDVRIAPVGQ